jgi:hypothetical protein
MLAHDRENLQDFPIDPMQSEGIVPAFFAATGAGLLAYPGATRGAPAQCSAVEFQQGDLQ